MPINPVNIQYPDYARATAAGTQNALAQAQLMSAGQQMQQRNALAPLQQRQAELGIQSGEIANELQGLKYIAGTAPRVSDQATYDAAVFDWQEKGLVKPGELPSKYSPAIIDRLSGVAAKRLSEVAPSSVREYEYVSGLAPEEQEKFLGIKRAGQYQTVAGVPTQVSPVAAPKPLSTQEKEIGFIAQREARKKEAIVKAEAKAKAQTVFPKVRVTYQKNKSLIGKVKNHPGMEAAFGKSSYLPALKGTDRANFEALLGQLKNTVFISNREALKGGGAITDFEGSKAEEAELRAANAQSKDAFMEALEEYEYWVDRGFESLKKAARGDYEPNYYEESPQTQQAAPPVNQQGWTLHRDANGNQAYVGPNGEIEEVR